MTLPSSLSRRAIRQRGFTMIEIAIALGVIGFALVAIMGILPFGMNVQRDNRAETIINQDATYWLEAIRNGAQAASFGEVDLTNYMVKIFAPSSNTNSPYELGNGSEGLAARKFDTTSDIITLLTYTGNNTESYVRAFVRAISGSAGEKGSEVSFTYQMEVSMFQPEPVDIPTLWDLSLTFRWPVVAERPPSGAKVLHYRTQISRSHVTTTNVLGTDFHLFNP